MLNVRDLWVKVSAAGLHLFSLLSLSPPSLSLSFVVCQSFLLPLTSDPISTQEQNKTQSLPEQPQETQRWSRTLITKVAHLYWDVIIDPFRLLCLGNLASYCCLCFHVPLIHIDGIKSLSVTHHVRCYLLNHDIE